MASPTPAASATDAPNPSPSSAATTAATDPVGALTPYSV